MADVSITKDMFGMKPLKLIDNGDGTYSLSMAATPGNIVHTIVDSIPAAATATDNVGAARMIDRIMNGTTALTPKRFFANIAASQTAASVVAAVTAKKLHVTELYFQAGGTATTITFNSASAAISCLCANAANVPAPFPTNEYGILETLSGEALTATTGAGSATGIMGTYCEA